MRKLFTLFWLMAGCLLAGYQLQAQETIVIDIPVKPVTILDPATVNPGILENGFEVVDVEGQPWFRVQVNGWSSWTHFPLVWLPQWATHFRTTAWMEAGTSGAQTEETYSFFKLYQDWGYEIAAGNDKSSEIPRVYEIPLFYPGGVGLLMVAIQDPADNWQGIKGAYLYFSKLEAVIQGNTNEFHAGDLNLLKTMRNTAESGWWEPLAATWSDEVNPLEWQGIQWSQTAPRRVTGLNLNNKGITHTDYTGFSDLAYLYIGGNPLGQLNVSGLTSLNSVNVNYSQLNSINLEGCINLYWLNLNWNQITEIEFTGLENLQHFYISNNALTELDLTGLDRLESINFANNKLTRITVPDNALYQNVDLVYNNLPFSRLILPEKVMGWYNNNPQNLIFQEQTIEAGTPIDFSSEAMINGIATVFKWYKNGQLIEGATSATYTPTEEAYYHAVMTNATFPGLELTTRSAKVGNPPEFDPGDLAILKAIRDNASTDVWEPLANIWADGIYPGEWPGVTWSENPPRRVTHLYIGHKGISVLDVTGLSQLTDLQCYGNQMQSLKVSGLANLHSLEAGSNQLTNITLTGLDNLTYLYLYGNQLTSVSLSGLNQLEQLNCDNNPLESLDLRTLANLRWLNCWNNELSEILVDESNKLYYANLQYNRLPFSQLYNFKQVCDNFEFLNQKLIFEEKALDFGEIIDFSTEAVFDGTVTTFSWYKNNVLIPNASGATHTPTDEAYYYAMMTNATFPDLVLTTRSIKVGNPPEFDPGDLAILKTIRDNASTDVWEPLATIWADGINPGEWTGVYWSEHAPKRVTQLYISGKGINTLEVNGLTQLSHLSCNYNQLMTITVTGLTNLFHLDVQGNQLTSLDLTGLNSLKYLYLYNNKLKQLTMPANFEFYGVEAAYNNLPFSQLILPGKVLHWYGYDPQNLIFEEQTVDPGTPIDFSSEATINGNATVFKWYKNGQLIEGATSATYTPTEEAYYHAVMTNATFPGLELTTRSAKVGNPPEFDPGDLAILKAIRDNASTDAWEPLANIWADGIYPGEWPGVYWSEQMPKRVISLQVNGKGISQMDVTGLSQLNDLHCFDNKLTALEVSGITNLQYLGAGNNQLTKITLSGLNNLRYLYLSSNQLSSVTLTGLNQLWELGLEYNKLTALDITGLSNLSYLYLVENKLTSLTTDPDLQLWGSNLQNNNLPFSQLILPEKVLGWYEYAPQNRVFEKQQINLGDAISYPSEHWVDGVETHFTWYKDGIEIPGAGNNYTYTPVEEGFYHCVMTNGKFPELELKTSQVTVGNPVPEFDQGDLAVLLAIRENMPQWHWLRNAWADEEMTGSWPNVVWTETEPGKSKRVTSLSLRWIQLALLEINTLAELRYLDCSGNQLQTLDLSGLVKLQYLYCAYNKLTSLDLGGLENLVNVNCYNNELTSLIVTDMPYLNWFNSQENRIPFSQMKPSSEGFYIHYHPQKDIYLNYPYVAGEPISYPEEVFVHGYQTRFNWYKNNELVLGNDLTGMYTPDGEGYYYCTMTNDAFPGVTLRTEAVKVGNPPEYDPYDISVLIAIRDAAPAGSRLKTDWADPENVANWPHLVWDFAPKKLVVMDVTNAQLTSLVVPGLTKLTQIYCQDNQISSLQLSNLPELRYLSAGNNQISQLKLDDHPMLDVLLLENNQLTELDVTGFSRLLHLYVQNNRLKEWKGLESLISAGELKFSGNFLPFSQMPLRTYQWTYEYIPQGKIFAEETLPVFTPIDFSSEALIGGVGTQFTWYFNGNPIEGTDQSGIYTPQVPGEYYCEMANDLFPGLVLTTHTITVISIAPDVVCNNIEVMPGMDGLYTLTAEDVAKIAAGTTDMTDSFEELQITVMPASFNLYTDRNPMEVTTEVTNSFGLSASCQSYVVMLKRPTALAFNSMTSVQYSDKTTISATLTDSNSKLLVSGMELTFTIGGESHKALTDASGVASVEYTASGAPGPVELGVSYAGNILFTGSSARSILTVEPEDAVVNYIGTEIAATASATNLTARIDLRASLTDIADLHRGDIRNAKIKFVNLTSGTPSDITGWLSVEDLTDPSTGVVSYPWTVTLQKNQTVETFTIAVVAGGYYTAHEEVVITVYVPSGDFITGGGHVIPSGSAGLYPSDEGSKTRFGFNVRYNKKGTATQGKLNFIFRSGGRTYQVTSNATESLGVNTTDPMNRTAQFTAKSTMTDITNPGSPVGMGGNLTMMINLSEVQDNDWEDKISFTLWSGNRLLYASNWDGAKSNLLPLASGQVVISSATVNNGKKSAEIEVSQGNSDGKALSVYPNPFTDRVFIDVKVDQTVPVLIEMFTITGMKVATVFDGQLEAGVQTRFEFRPETIPAQILLYRIVTGDEMHTGRLVYRPVN